LEEVSLEFQPTNLMVFDINSNVMMNLKSNQFSSKKYNITNKIIGSIYNKKNQ